MTHSYGYRRGTRKKFARPFQQHGTHKLKRFLTKYRIGDYVDVLVDGSQHKGLPFKYFHGRTGKVFNVNPKSLGVVLLKQVKHRFIEKRLNIRLDHLRKSNCREAFVKRVQANDKKKNEVNQQNKKNNTNLRISTKRIPQGPLGAHLVKPTKIDLQQPVIFREKF